jgi:Mn-dependent DtxR family transcriptional regulator
LIEKFPESMATGEIAEKLNKKVNNISTMLKKLESKGKVIQPGYGKWSYNRDSVDS